MEETTLSRLCLISFKYNLYSILYYYQNQGLQIKSLFECFPPNICENFMKIASTILNPELLFYLFKKGIKEIYLPYYNEDIPLKKFISISEGITCMILNCVPLSERMIQKLVSHLPNIIVLKLSQTNVTDSTLEIIGKTCTYLECLDVSFCSITDNGLYVLCRSTENTEEVRCEHLKVLRIFNARITERGLACVLMNIPIVKIYAELDIYLKSICCFIKYNFSKCLRIKCLNVLPIEERVNLLEILLSIPEVESLCIYRTSLEDADVISLPRFENLRRLSLSVNRNDKMLTFEDGVIYLLVISGKQLDELRLNNFQYVNAYLIGKYCNNLRSLELYSIRHLYFRQDLSGEIKPILLSLNYLKLKNLLGKPWDDCLASIFRNSPNLMELIVMSSLCLTDAIMFQIIPVLKNVNYIIICNCDNITKMSIYSVLDKITNLRSLWISSRRNILTKTEEKLIQDYIMSNYITCDFFYQVNYNYTMDQGANLREMRFYF
ncbi:uncharacterized protein LOC111623643 [Centruroides sculpturatus]|uniref:uncharacterized protein LOC111623643 n=1 Tax=Centruroides sculpturatus TaxID=218467 RepID=UPI000C6E7B5F|nr:uncharacterized protein LOC111623643 [Centruroides sculpturatus]